MIYLDTNTLIRFFVKDDIVKSTKVKKLFEQEDEVCIQDVVFPEIEYVLKRHYNYQRNKIVKIFKFLISLPNNKVNQYIPKAISIFEQTSFDMADCIIIAASFGGKLASFDNNLLRAPGVKPYW